MRGMKRVHGEAVSANVDAPAAGEVLGDAIGLVEGQRKLPHRNSKTDVAQEVDGSETMMRDLVDVEGKFSLNVLVLALGVIDGRPVFRPELWKLDGDGDVGGFGVTDRVADVVRKRADGEGQFVGVVSHCGRG